LKLIDDMAIERCAQLVMKLQDYRFSRRELRDYTRWSETQLRVHLDRLMQMEYVLAHRGTRGQSYVYELMWDGQGKDGEAHLPGLFDVETFKNAGTTKSSRGEIPQFAAPSRGQNGVFAGGSRGGEITKNTDKNSYEYGDAEEAEENKYLAPFGIDESYRNDNTIAAKPR
jgi:hypothetical protein